MKSLVISTAGLISYLLFFSLTIISANQAPFKSVELGLAELSPAGEAGGFAIPASGASTPTWSSESCSVGASGPYVTLSWSPSYNTSSHNHAITYNVIIDGLTSVGGYSATSWGLYVPAGVTYSWRVQGCTGGTCSSYVYSSFKCNYPPPTATLQVKDDTAGTAWTTNDIDVQVGNQISLNWTSTYSTSCSGSNFSVPGGGTSGTQGDVTEPILGETISYTVGCLGQDSTTAYDTVQVTGIGDPPEIGLCSGTSVVRSGDDRDICWNAKDAEPDMCTVSGPGLNQALDSATAVGNANVTVSNESTYTIDCGISGSDEVILEVLPVIQET